MNSERDCLPRLSRRVLLQQTATMACAAALPRWGIAADAPNGWQSRVLAYLETLSRDDGGYAWSDQPVSHLSPTFAVLACYRVLQQKVPRPDACAAFVRTHHPTEWKKLEQEHREFDYQQIQSLVWLGADVQAFRDRVLGWKEPVAYLPQYERHRYPVLRFQLAAVTCRHLLGMPAADAPPAWKEYLQSRQRANGSFNNTPAEDGSDGNILDTWWGLESLNILGTLDNKTGERTIEWLQSCQAPDGGFRWQPKPKYGKQSDVAYTWAAIRSLTVLKARPRDLAGAIGYIQSLQNADGGFGDRPGWNSNAMATRYALESLADLQALDQLPAMPVQKSREAIVIPANLKVYTIQIEAHGTGSPTEAVDLARELKIDLWGAKNASRRWLETAQGIADREHVPVTFFVANEEYGTWIDLPGFGTYSHMSDLVASAGTSIGPALNARGDLSTWEEFRQKRVDPLQAGDGRLIWQFGENEELVRTVLDDSVESGGYAAINTFHFGNPDFTNSEPFLNRYRGRLPFVALQDAHGQEPWWFADMTTGFRTLFLATEPTWNGWLTALKNNWVACARRDAVTDFKLRMHSGSDEVAAFVSARETDWRWWNNPRIARPMVSLVAIRPEDELETHRPEKGVTIRIRCAGTNTTQGKPKTPLAEFKSLRIDGEPIQPELIERPGNKGARLSDHAHVVHLPEIAAGDHHAAVTVISLADGREHQREIRFHV